MSELKTSVVIDLSGNLQRRARAYTKSLNRFSSRGRRSLGALSRTAAVTGRMLNKMGNRYTGVLSGAAAAGTGKFVIGLQRRFTRLGIQANKSAEDINKLKTQIYDTAAAPDIRVDPGEITSAIEAIVEKTGDLKFAQDNIRNIGLAIQATGASGASIGEILAEFQKMDIKDPTQVLKAIDTLNVQGKEGAFTLQNLASLGPRVVTAYTSLGRTGTPALKEMGAALQVIRMGTGSSEQAATAFEAVLRTFSDNKKLKQLQSGGIQVFDVEQLKNGKEVLRPINELMAEIIAKTEGKKTLLSKVFDAEAIRAFNQAAAEFQRTGGVSSLNKFMQMQGNGTTTIDDSTRAAKDAAGAMRNLYTAWQRFSDESLTGPIQDLADALNSISSEKTGEIIKGAIITGTGAVVGGKAYGLGKKLFGSGAAATVADAVTEQAPKVKRGLGSALGVKPKAAPSLLSRAGKQAIRFGKFAGPVGLAAGAGYAAGSVVNNYLIKGTDLEKTIGGTIAQILASLGNENAQRALNADLKSQQTQFNGEVKIQIESDKPVKVKQLNTDNKNFDLQVNSGLTMGGAL